MRRWRKLAEQERRGIFKQRVSLMRKRREEEAPGDALFTMDDVDASVLVHGIAKRLRSGIFETRERVVRNVCVYALTPRHHIDSAPPHRR